MMKLVLSLTLIWTFSSTAGALQCQTCTNADCSRTEPQTCFSDTMCVTAAIQVTSSGTTRQQIVKACASSPVCPATGPQTSSTNFGVASSVISAKCCNTDNCNSETLPFPAAQTNNSLQCLTCNYSTSQCTSKLQCKGVEDRCFQVKVTTGNTTTPFFGCASANQCAATAGLGSLPFMESANFTSGPACCGTNLCTAATTASDACCIRLGMFHLLLGLLFFTLC